MSDEGATPHEGIELRIRIAGHGAGAGPPGAAGPVAGLIGRIREQDRLRFAGLVEGARRGQPEAIRALMEEARAGHKPSAEGLRKALARGDARALAGLVDPQAERDAFDSLAAGLRGGDAEALEGLWSILEERHRRATAELLDRVRAGDEAAQGVVFDEFVGRMKALARSRIYARVRQISEPEDAAMSAYKSFFKPGVLGRDFNDYNHLWAILALIVLRKCCKYNKKFARDATPDDEAAFEWAAVGEDEPQAEATLRDLVEEIRGAFEDPGDREIVEHYLQGTRPRAIAGLVGRSETAVHRVIKRLWERMERLGIARPGGGDRPE